MPAERKRPHGVGCLDLGMACAKRAVEKGCADRSQTYLTGTLAPEESELKLALFEALSARNALTSCDSSLLPSRSRSVSLNFKPSLRRDALVTRLNLNAS